MYKNLSILEVDDDQSEQNDFVTGHEGFIP